MAINLTGPVRLGGDVVGTDVAKELNLLATAPITMNDTAVRALAQKTIGAISFADFRGKSSGSTTTTTTTTTIAPTTTTTTSGPPTYTITTTPSTSTIEEGNSLLVTITTTNVGGATLYWTVSGTNVSDADFSSPSNVVSSGGSVIITSNSGTFTLVIASDGIVEGTSPFTISLRTNSTSGTVVATKTIAMIDPTTTTAPTTTTTTAPTTTTTTTAAPTTTTTTTAAVPNVQYTATAGCSPNVAGSGTIAITGVTGGLNGNYYFKLGTNAAVGPFSSYTFTGVANGTQIVKVYNLVNGSEVYATTKGVVVSCPTGTTAAPTTTTTTAAPTTTTTTAAATTTTTTAAGTTTTSAPVTTYTVNLIAKRASNSGGATLHYGINNQNTPDGGSALTLASVTKYTLTVNSGNTVWVRIKNIDGTSDMFCAQVGSYCTTANFGPDGFVITANTDIYIQSYVSI